MERGWRPGVETGQKEVRIGKYNKGYIICMQKKIS